MLHSDRSEIDGMFWQVRSRRDRGLQTGFHRRPGVGPVAFHGEGSVHLPQRSGGIGRCVWYRGMTATMERVHTESRHYRVTMPCDFPEFGVRAGDVAFVDTEEPLQEGDYGLAVTRDGQYRVFQNNGSRLASGWRYFGRISYLGYAPARRQEDATVEAASPGSE